MRRRQRQRGSLRQSAPLFVFAPRRPHGPVSRQPRRNVTAATSQEVGTFAARRGRHSSRASSGLRVRVHQLNTDALAGTPPTIFPLASSALRFRRTAIARHAQTQWRRSPRAGGGNKPRVVRHPAAAVTAPPGWSGSIPRANVRFRPIAFEIRHRNETPLSAKRLTLALQRDAECLNFKNSPGEPTKWPRRGSILPGRR
jgi:hypothetical protein